MQRSERRYLLRDLEIDSILPNKRFHVPGFKFVSVIQDNSHTLLSSISILQMYLEEDGREKGTKDIPIFSP